MLRVREIMYYPAALTEEEIEASFTNDDDFEYLILTSPTDKAIVLKGIRFTDGIPFTVEDETPLAPGRHAVIVRNAEAFAHRCGSPLRVLGTYSQALSNGGERLAVVGAFDGPILEFSYRDDCQEATNGDGSALLLTNLNAPDTAENWQVTAPFQIRPAPNRPRLSIHQESETAFILIPDAQSTSTYLLETSSDLDQWTIDRQMTATEQATATATTTVTVTVGIEETQFYRVRLITQ
ncbi:MAG: hypothetical protein P1U82_18890 [Verrucomicrobiales bacterium]|jgi:hypothetical protein|nr:lamin tail domain-containing protein [Verrucomicrobiales bacterium]MDF1787938.1 hypothetical protein [Verrucomicrobiales bacterium]